MFIISKVSDLLVLPCRFFVRPTKEIGARPNISPQLREATFAFESDLKYKQTKDWIEYPWFYFATIVLPSWLHGALYFVRWDCGGTNIAIKSLGGLWIQNSSKTCTFDKIYRMSRKKWCIAISNSRVVLDDQRLIKLTDTWSAPPHLTFRKKTFHENSFNFVTKKLRTFRLVSFESPRRGLHFIY